MKSDKVIDGYKYFESQQPDEKVEIIVRRHWTYLVVPFIVGIIIIMLTAIVFSLIISINSEFISGSGELIMSCIISLIVLFTILYIFLSWLIRYLNVIILTNEHLVEIEQSAIFSRKVSELDLDCIEDASAFQKGFFQTMLRFGEVLVQTAGELPNFDFKGVPFPYEVSQKVMEVKENFMNNKQILTNNINSSNIEKSNEDLGMKNASELNLPNDSNEII